MTVLPDGKFVIVGTLGGTGAQFAAAKFNQDGTPDNTFDGDGKLTTAVAATGNTAFSVAAQTDGKLVLAGSANNETAIVRYTAAGALDTTFDGDGIVITAISSGLDRAKSISILPDGKIVVGIETTQTDTARDVGLARYNADGSLDASFGTNGIAVYPFALTQELSEIAVQPDGKIVAAGQWITAAVAYDFLVFRANQDGALDSSWGTGGIVNTNFNQVSNDFAASVIIQSDGKIVAAGQTGTTSGPADFALARYNSAATNRKTDFDFDGDGKSDLGVFRPAGANWYLQRSANGFAALSFGLAADKLVPADYDGDGKTDIAVWRESDGNFYILRSTDNAVRYEHFGAAGDVPVSGDFDGDGKADLAVYRDGAQSYFFYRASLNNPNGDVTALHWGTSGDLPVLGDFDGDGKADAAVFRPSNGTWYSRDSATGALRFERWGLGGDRLVAADYDGDGKTDAAVFREGNWYIRQSSNGQERYEAFGVATDAAAAADYDGDGRADIAVFRAGNWYIKQSSSGAISYPTFGINGDLPIAAAYLR